MELRKDEVHPRRNENEVLASLLTKAKSLKKMDITPVVRNVILSGQSHLQVSQTRGLQLSSLGKSTP